MRFDYDTKWCSLRIRPNQHNAHPTVRTSVWHMRGWLIEYRDDCAPNDATSERARCRQRQWWWVTCGWASNWRCNVCLCVYVCVSGAYYESRQVCVLKCALELLLAYVCVNIAWCRCVLAVRDVLSCRRVCCRRLCRVFCSDPRHICRCLVLVSAALLLRYFTWCLFTIQQLAGIERKRGRVRGTCDFRDIYYMMPDLCVFVCLE